MSVFLRYLASLMLHMMWHRAGNKGALPPVRLPRKGTVKLPVIGPWQMMIAMWMMKRMWNRYGSDVKTHLMTRDNSVANRIGAYLPSDASIDPAPSGAPASVAIPASSATSPSPASHDTRPLPTNAAQGSVLSKLRGTAPGASASG